MLLLQTVLALSISSGPVVSSLETEAYSRAYGPRSTMLVAKPTLKWEIWPAGNGSVTSKKMVINGREVEAVYSERDKALVYAPRVPFQPGNYRVECRVVINDSLVANKEWTFTVAPEAKHDLPTPDLEQMRALRAANEFRKSIGLDPFRLDNRLCAASLAHSKYLSRNNLTGHFQKPGTPGYFGNTPGDRLESFGYVNESWECVDYGHSEPEDGVQSLIDAPYHRLPFLQPGSIEVGTGYADRRLTMEFGGTSESGVVVYPSAGQTNVPTFWSANERPNPLRLHGGAKLPVGYIVVFSYWQPNGVEIDVTSATMKAVSDGSTVNVYLNTPDNDQQLTNACFLIPQKPLKAATTYEVYVRAQTTGERTAKKVVEKRWQFTTGR